MTSFDKAELEFYLPKEYLKAECERCQEESDIRELHEIRFINSFKVVCESCKHNLEGYENECV